MLSIDTSRLRIGGRTLAEPMKFHVPQKEIHLLEGPNGCGKSLLLDAVTGVQRLSGVKASIGGRRFLRGTSFTRWQAGIRRLFQNPTLPGELTVQQVLDRLVPEKAVDGAWIRQSLAFLSSSGVRFAKPLGIHSFGQQRAVELVAALATGSCCLLDEPFAGLSPTFVPQAMQLIRDAADRGKPILVIDHTDDQHSKFYNQVYSWRVPKESIPQPTGAFPYPSLKIFVSQHEDARPYAARWIVRKFGIEERTILKDVEIGLRPGHLLFLIGGNGSGNSTLLRELGKFPQPWAGVDSDIEFKNEGAPVKMLLSPQPPKLVAELSVEENLRLMIRGGESFSRADLESIRQVLAWLGVSAGQLKSRAEVLSNGEAAIVALVGLLLSPAEVLLLDEPFESFSSETMRGSVALIRAALENGKSIIASTHNAQIISSVEPGQAINLSQNGVLSGKWEGMPLASG